MTSSTAAWASATGPRNPSRDLRGPPRASGPGPAAAHGRRSGASARGSVQIVRLWSSGLLCRRVELCYTLRICYHRECTPREGCCEAACQHRRHVPMYLWNKLLDLVALTLWRIWSIAADIGLPRQLLLSILGGLLAVLAVALCVWLYVRARAK